MPTVEADITVAASQEALFRLSQDYHVRMEWDPFLRDLRFLGGAQEAAVGVRVWVKAWTGLAMTVEYISVVPPTVVAVHMVEGPRFFENFAGTWRFRAVDASATRVAFRYSFTTRWPWLRPALDPIVQRVFTWDIARRLRALKHAAEETDVSARIDQPPGHA